MKEVSVQTYTVELVIRVSFIQLLKNSQLLQTCFVPGDEEPSGTVTCSLFSLSLLPFSLVLFHPPFPLPSFPLFSLFPYIISLFLMILMATSMFPLSESLARTTLLNTPCPVYPYTVYRRSSCSPMRTPVIKIATNIERLYTTFQKDVKRIVQEINPATCLQVNKGA